MVKRYKLPAESPGDGRYSMATRLMMYNCILESC